jgi:acyl carrier protein
LHEEGARLYRSGDLGRLLPDGQIEFHGRRDNQIKLRGNRIELDEISAALDRHPLVVQSAVSARGDGNNVQLIAYMVLRGGAPVVAESLREFLANRLPDYMLPLAFVAIPSLPLTASGKLDVEALPVPDDANRLPETEYREPSSQVEISIAAIVAELLDLDRVGSEDNFFLLGGHSLLGTQLVLRARDAFGVELTLRDLFKAQSVSKLAATIERRLIESIEQMSDEEAGALLAG